jgi:predicted transcriptional regulator
MNDLYDPNLSESEVQARLVADTAQKWMAESEEGRTFAALYNTTQNRKILAEVFDLLDEEITFATLSGAFKKLVARGAIQTDAERQAAQEQALRQRDEMNRQKWESDCSRYVESHSTNQVKARAEKDPAFRAYLKDANRLPQLTVEYDPVQVARHSKEQKAQRIKDAPYLNVPQELRDFARDYQKMPFAEVQQRQRDPQFRQQVEAASAVRLI